MARSCDNTSVGVVIRNGSGDVLLLERARFPFGLAAPAGHIDDHGSPEQAATAEVFEEVGLYVPITSLCKVIDNRRMDNKCRRINGSFHIWNVYEANSIEDNLSPSTTETRGALWRTMEELDLLAINARNNADIAPRVGAQVLELIWLNFFTELGVISGHQGRD